MVKIVRQIIMSGTRKYVPLLPEEKAGYEVALYLTNLTVAPSFYQNAEWYPERRFFGRVVLQEVEYAIGTHLIQFNNELIYNEKATELFELHNAQCTHIESQYLMLELFKKTVGYFQQIAADLPISLPLVAASSLISLADANTLQAGGEVIRGTPGVDGASYRAYRPRKANGLKLDGISYSMPEGVSGQLSICSWRFDDDCKIPGTTVSATQDGRGLPPATAGGPDAVGGGGNVPPATGTGEPPPPGGARSPTDSDPSPPGPPDRPGIPPAQTLPGVGYIVKYGYSTDAGAKNNFQSELLGPISGWETTTQGFNTVRTLYQGSPGGGPRRQVQRVAWYAESDFPNQRYSGFYVTIVRRA